MPLAHDPRTIFLGVLCAIAVLACLYVAQDIVLPVVLALVLKLLLQPLVSLLERLHVQG
jgi:predicted PurR-regulated permease PerM